MSMVNVEVLDEFVTEEFLSKLFRRTKLTILHWRQRAGLPHVSIPGDARPAIRYRYTEVIKWARATGRRVYPVA